MLSPPWMEDADDFELFGYSLEDYEEIGFTRPMFDQLTREWLPAVPEVGGGQR